MMKLYRLITAFFLLPIASGAAAQWYVEPTRNGAMPRYSMQVSIQPERRRLAVSGEVLLQPNRPDELRFSLRSDMQSLAMSVLSPSSCAGPLMLKSGGIDPKLLESQLWEAKPLHPCPLTAPVRVAFSYAGGESATGAGFFAIRPEGSFAAGGISSWYPKFGYGRASGSIKFIVPSALTVRASGRAIPPTRIGETTEFSFSSDSPVIFDFAVGAYKVIKRSAGSVPVSLYLLQNHPREDEMLRREVANMALLQTVFGPYPFGEFAIVEVPSAPAQEAGFLGLSQQGFFLGRSDMLARDKIDVAYFAHELGHQWFPYLVTRAGDGSDLMMTEALAHYGAIQAVEKELGSAEGEQFRSDLTRDALSLMAAGFDYPLSKLPDDRPALPLSNRKGGLVYDMLARTIGRDRFHAALIKMTSRHRYGSLTWTAFLNEISKESGQNLEWFYRQWLDRPGAPIVSLEWDQSGSTLKYTVLQQGAPYRLTLPVQIEFADGSSTAREVRTSKQSETFALKVGHVVHAVRLDPHRTVFRATPEEWAEALSKAAYTKGRLQWDSNETAKALLTFREGLRNLPKPDPYGVEFLLRTHLGWIAQEAGDNAGARKEYRRALQLSVRSPEFLPQVYWNLAKILEQEKDCVGALLSAKGVIDSEISARNVTSRTKRATDMIARLQQGSLNCSIATER